MTDATPAPTASEICNALGRKDIAARVGVRATAVSNAAVDGIFPAYWFLAIREMCDEKGIPCPESLFRFRQASTDASAEAAE